MTVALALCPSCGSSHLPPVPCHLSFRQRLLSVRIDPSPDTLPNFERRNYFDQAAVDDQFGPDAKERWLDMTEGHGAIRRKGRGFEMQRFGLEAEPSGALGHAPVIGGDA